MLDLKASEKQLTSLLLTSHWSRQVTWLCPSSGRWGEWRGEKPYRGTVRGKASGVVIRAVLLSRSEVRASALPPGMLITDSNPSWVSWPESSPSPTFAISVHLPRLSMPAAEPARWSARHPKPLCWHISPEPNPAPEVWE